MGLAGTLILIVLAAFVGNLILLVVLKRPRG